MTKALKPKQAINAGPFRDAVKLIYGYLTVLAITNSVKVFAEAYLASGAQSAPVPMNAEIWVTFVFSTTLILRFFFGNIAHFNSDEDDDPFEIVFDSVVIILQAIMIGYSTFFLTDLSQYFVVVNLIFLTDLLWYTVSTIVNWWRKKDSDVDRRVGVSQIVSLGTFLCLWILNLEHLGSKFYLIFWSMDATLVSAIVSYVIVNTLFDFKVNWRRYINFRNP